MKIRPYTPEDVQEMADLFYDTVHAVNARDYAPEQLDAWATGEVDLDAWDRSFRAHRTLVAEEDGTIVGFADMDDAGYLDRLYVHKDHQGRGVAAPLCGAPAGGSAPPPVPRPPPPTPPPPFCEAGYTVVTEQRVQRRGVTLTNYAMEKIR